MWVTKWVSSPGHCSPGILFLLTILSHCYRQIYIVWHRAGIYRWPVTMVQVPWLKKGCGWKGSWVSHAHCPGREGMYASTQPPRSPQNSDVSCCPVLLEKPPSPNSVRARKAMPWSWATCPPFWDIIRIKPSLYFKWMSRAALNQVGYKRCCWHCAFYVP